MSKFKKILFAGVSYALVGALAIGGTFAYLTGEDEDVNVMTLGNVKIEQHTYERVVENGAWVSIGDTDKYGYIPDEFQEFTQAKPLYPAVFADGVIKWDDRNGSQDASGATSHQQSWGQIKAPGSNQLFDDSVKNAQDKFVFVENTGKTDAYVRTVFAFEQGSIAADTFSDVIMTNTNVNHWSWETNATDVEIGGNEYVIRTATYLGPKSNPTGILAPGATSYANLLQVYMKPEVTNEDCAAIDGNKNGTYDVLVLSQAVQSAGFESGVTTFAATSNVNAAGFALDTAFGEVTAENAKVWFEGMYIPNYSLSAATVGEDGVVTVPAGETQVLSGSFDKAITVAGEGTLYLRDAVIVATDGFAMKLAEGATTKFVIENNVTLKGVTNGIEVPAGSKLDLSGKGGTLTVIGGNGVDSENGGSGIGGAGTIYIHDLKDLIAKGYGKAGFGIGGESSSITIENTNISYVKGGYVQPNFINDTSYGKSEPEGGAAIGSMTDGAVIILENVTIENAEGGSKSAGIGARYWTGVTVNITDCDIKHVQGGNASAGIGGSRVSGDATDSDEVTINIHNSKITAVGGEFGAGIGSGYDTHCKAGQPVHTIIITGDSVIDATGGKYGAGIGTGYHVASLAGKIDATVTVNATAGASREKYTKAMEVGFGVIDKTREGNNNASSFDYKGTTITVSTAPDVQ